MSTKTLEDMDFNPTTLAEAALITRHLDKLCSVVFQSLTVIASTHFYKANVWYGLFWHEQNDGPVES